MSGFSPSTRTAEEIGKASTLTGLWDIKKNLKPPKGSTGKYDLKKKLTFNLKTRKRFHDHWLPVSDDAEEGVWRHFGTGEVRRDLFCCQNGAWRGK